MKTVSRIVPVPVALSYTQTGVAYSAATSFTFRDTTAPIAGTRFLRKLLAPSTETSPKIERGSDPLCAIGAHLA